MTVILGEIKMGIIRRLAFILLGIAIFIPAQFVFRMEKNITTEEGQFAAWIFEVPAFALMCLAAWLVFSAGGKRKAKGPK